MVRVGKKKAPKKRGGRGGGGGVKGQQTKKIDCGIMLVNAGSGTK